MSVTVAAQQLTETAVVTADGRNRREGILHGVNVGVTITVEVPGDQALQRRDLGEARQRFKMECAVRLAEKNSAAQFRGGEALRFGQFVFAKNFSQGCARVTLGRARRDLVSL